MKQLIVFGTALFLLNCVIDVECATKAFTYDSNPWNREKTRIEARGNIMDKGEEGDGSGVEQEIGPDAKGENDTYGPPPPPKKPSHGNSKNKQDSKSKKEDDIMTDLLRPESESKNGTTTMKPFVVVNHNKQKPGSKKPRPGVDIDDEELTEGTELKSAIDKALEKATSIADSISDAIKAAINRVASQLKSATSTSSSSSSSSHDSKNQNNCTSSHESIEHETTPSSGKSGSPIPSTTTKRHRRSSEVARWPPRLPLSHLPAQTFSDGEDISANVTSSDGGIITQGKVGDYSEESSEHAVQMTTSSNMYTSSTTSEANDDGKHASQDEDSQDAVNSSAGRNNRTRNSPPGKSNKTLKPSSQRDVTLTVSGSGSDDLGSSIGSIPIGSSSIGGSLPSGSQMYPQYPAIRKPGRCRPLTSGLACIALTPDASQCSSDNGCPGTKKCCFYGCAPYTGIGICEYPVLHPVMSG